MLLMYNVTRVTKGNFVLKSRVFAVMVNNKIRTVNSIYRQNDITKPVAESFEGSGVLQVLVN